MNTTIKDFYFVYFPIGYDFIQTMLSTFKYVPKKTNIIVVTNHPEVLDNIQVDFNLIILNLDDLRDEWSKENEILIYEIDAQEYRNRSSEFQKNGIRFPYAFHRCILPWLAERNINKFAIIDTDCLINYRNELELVLDNQSKDFGNDKIIFGPTMNTTSYRDEFIKLSADTLNKYNIDIDIIKNMPDQYYCFDGWLRGFWFDSPNDTILFYNLWNEILKKSYEYKTHLIYQNVHAISDEWLHGLVSYIFSQKCNAIVKDYYYNSFRIVTHIYHPENYYFKLPHGLYHTHYEMISTESRKEFFEKNREKIIKFYTNQNSIEEHRIKEVIHDWYE